MADDYQPPLSPAIDFIFKGGDYQPPISPEVVFIFGAQESESDAGQLRSNFMILLTM